MSLRFPRSKLRSYGVLLAFALVNIASTTAALFADAIPSALKKSLALLVGLLVAIWGALEASTDVGESDNASERVKKWAPSLRFVLTAIPLGAAFGLVMSSDRVTAYIILSIVLVLLVFFGACLIYKRDDSPSTSSDSGASTTHPA